MTCEAGKWYLIASNFESTNGSALDVKDFINGLTAGTSEATSPTIQYWDGSKLVTVCYMEDMFDAAEDDFITGWGQPAVGETMALPVPPGFGCWFKVPVTTTITCPGQVVDADSKSANLTANWQLMGNPYPIGFSLNDSTKVDCAGLTAGTSEATSPTIQYWDGTKLVTVCYMEDMFDVTEDDFIIGWGQPAVGETTDLIINPCTGFWIKDPNAGTIKFYK
jgi:hypothetical protein